MWLPGELIIQVTPSSFTCLILIIECLNIDFFQNIRCEDKSVESLAYKTDMEELKSIDKDFKKGGHRTELCGTPENTFSLQDLCSLLLKTICPVFRYDSTNVNSMYLKHIIFKLKNFVRYTIKGFE